MLGRKPEKPRMRRVGGALGIITIILAEAASVGSGSGIRGRGEAAKKGSNTRCYVGREKPIDAAQNRPTVRKRARYGIVGKGRMGRVK